MVPGRTRPRHVSKYTEKYDQTSGRLNFATVRTKYRFLDVYSDKNSLAIIYICSKMHFLRPLPHTRSREVP